MDGGGGGRGGGCNSGLGVNSGIVDKGEVPNEDIGGADGYKLVGNELLPAETLGEEIIGTGIVICPLPPG